MASPRSEDLQMRCLCVMVVIAAAVSPSMAEVVFFDGFEAGMGNWFRWFDVSWAPRPDCPQMQNCWGPQALLHSDNHPHEGVRCARQEKAQPWWYGGVHEEPFLDNSRTIRVSVWQFEDANPRHLRPALPGEEGYRNHDQVQGWLAIMDSSETEFAALGVHAHWASPEPVLSWWENLSWGTAADDWHATNVPRRQGFRHLEIWVHPYTGGEADIEFFIDGTKVGQGRRVAGVDVDRVAIGASPAHIAEDYIANTYEFFWYDEVLLRVGFAGDFDGDDDVDVNDFARFQVCFNGPGYPPADPGCEPADLDADGDVDVGDFALFQACFNGPGQFPPLSCP